MDKTSGPSTDDKLPFLQTGLTCRVWPTIGPSRKLSVGIEHTLTLGMGNIFVYGVIQRGHLKTLT